MKTSSSKKKSRTAFFINAVPYFLLPVVPLNVLKLEKNVITTEKASAVLKEVRNLLELKRYTFPLIFSFLLSLYVIKNSESRILVFLFFLLSGIVAYFGVKFSFKMDSVSNFLLSLVIVVASYIFSFKTGNLSIASVTVIGVFFWSFVAVCYLFLYDNLNIYFIFMNKDEKREKTEKVSGYLVFKIFTRR